MVEISIICLVYKSKKLTKAVYDSLYENTPMLRSGKAELIFVANDPTVELVEFLKEQKYPFVINVNEHLSDEEMFKLGYGKPEYIRRVYRGYNRGILEAKGNKICLINSDNFFSEDWLENLLKYLDYKKVVCATLVEPGHDKFGVFPFAVRANFGKTVDDFQKEQFYQFAASISKTGFLSGGAYMPCLMYKDVAIFAGLYPEGNLAGNDFDTIIRYGDEDFYDRLQAFGIKHITAKDSVVYHLKEGEISDTETGKVINDKKYQYIGLSSKYSIKPSESINYISPESAHTDIMEKMGRKFTTIIANFKTIKELHAQIKQVQKLLGDQAEIVVVYEQKFKLPTLPKNIKCLKLPKTSQYKVVSDMLYKMYGEYLFICQNNVHYSDNLFDFIEASKELHYLGCATETLDLKKTPISNFILSKSFLTKKANFYADLIVSGLDGNFVDYHDKIIYLDDVRHMSTNNIDSLSQPQDVPYYKQTLPYRALRKLYREGPVAVTRTIYHRMRKK